MITEEKDVVFDDKLWKRISKKAREFVKRLLNKDPNKRPTASEAL